MLLACCCCRLIVVAMRQQGQWRQCRVPAGIRAKVKQPTIFSALLLASYIHCCSHCPWQLHVAVTTTITVIVFAAVVVTVTVVATFAIAVVSAAAVTIILAVRVTAAALLSRCRRFHHLRIDVVASSSPLWPSPSPSCYRCRVIATVPLCGIAVTVVASFSTVTFTITSVSSFLPSSFLPLFRCPDPLSSLSSLLPSPSPSHHRFIVVANVAISFQSMLLHC